MVKRKGEDMADWNTRKRSMFIPDMDTPKTYECEVCGSKIVPRKANRYVVKALEIAPGMANVITGEKKVERYYDAYDCPTCGCQIIAKRRLLEI